MKNVLVVLPQDEDAERLRALRAWADAQGWDLRLPARDMLDTGVEPVRRDALAAWLEREALDAAAVVACADMLVYGATPPSRHSADELNALLPRLAVLNRLKMRKRRLVLRVFAALLGEGDEAVRGRACSEQDSHASRLRAWSHYADKSEQTGDTSAATLAFRAEGDIPERVRSEYRAFRARHFGVNTALLALAGEAVIDQLRLVHASTMDYGFAAAEQRELQVRVIGAGLEQRVQITAAAHDPALAMAVQLGRPQRRKRSVRRQAAVRASP